MPPATLTFDYRPAEGIDAGRVRDAALLIGRRFVPVPGRIEVRQDRIVVEVPEVESVCLALPVDLGELGVLRVQTSLLLPREHPYELLYELARQRIKHFLWKAEEWQMWDPDAAPQAMAEFERARGLLAEASMQADPASAGRLARSSIIAATEALESLALAQSRLHLRRKYGRRGAPRTAAGIRIEPHLSTSLVGEAPLEPFQLLALPTRWRELEPRRGAFEWERLDRWMVAAATAKRRVLAGPLLDLSTAHLPDWALALRGDATAFREAAYAFCEAVVQRYRGAVGMWNIASGMPAHTERREDQEWVIGLTRMASVLVRQRHPGGKILVELVDPASERRWRRHEGLDAHRYLRLLSEGGIHFDCVGLRVTMGESLAGSRDLSEIAALADRFVSTDWHVVVTALGAPSAGGDGQAWHRGWTPATQAAWLESALSILLARPRCDAVVLAAVMDAAEAGTPTVGAVGAGGALGLFDAGGRAKPALARVGGVLAALRGPAGSGASNAGESRA